MSRLRVVEIEKSEKYLAWTDVEGNRHEYARPPRPLHLHVQELKARHSFAQLTLPEQFSTRRDEALSGAALQMSFIGTVLLEDQGLEVIGFPETKSRVLSVEFRLQPPGELEGQETIQSVMLGYSFSAREMDNAHGWWLSVLLPPTQFTALVDAMAVRQLSKLSLTLHLDNLYVREWPPLAEGKVNWYLPPDMNPGGGAKIASGILHSLCLETLPLDLRPPAPQDIEMELLNQDADYKPPPDDKLAHAVEAVAANVGGLQTILKYLVVGLLILVFVVGRKL